MGNVVSLQEVYCDCCRKVVLMGNVVPFLRHPYSSEKRQATFPHVSVKLTHFLLSISSSGGEIMKVLSLKDSD